MKNFRLDFRLYYWKLLIQFVCVPEISWGFFIIELFLITALRIVFLLQRSVARQQEKSRKVLPLAGK